MITYRLTFGSQYAREEHPSGLEWIHPDGWVEIEAPDESAARSLAVERLGTAWSWLYTPEQYEADELWEAGWFPRGVLATWSQDDGYLPPEMADEQRNAT